MSMSVASSSRHPTTAPWLPDGLASRVSEAIPLLLEGALLDVVGDTGGAGLCAEVTEDLLDHLGSPPASRALWLDLLHRTSNCGGVQVPEAYPWPSWMFRQHCVALVGEWVVDLTARQYDDRLPFPYFWPATRVEPLRWRVR